MVDKLDIIELRKVKDDKQKRRVKIYEEILKNCHNRIIMHSNEENDCCFYKVPEFQTQVDQPSIQSHLRPLSSLFYRNIWHFQFDPHDWLDETGE